MQDRRDRAAIQNTQPRGPGHGGPGPMGARRIEKAKDFKKSIKTLILSLRQYWGILIAVLIFSALGTVFTILGPKIVENISKEIIKGILPGNSVDFAKINSIGILLVVFYTLALIFNYIQHYLSAYVSAKVSKHFRAEISRKINRLPLKFFDTGSRGDILSRVTNDVDTIGQTLSQSLSSMVTSVTTVIGIIIMMFTISWQLTLVNMVTVPVSFILISVIIGFSQKYFKVQQKALGTINGHIEEIYSSHEVVKLFNGEKDALGKFDEVNEKLYASGYKAQFLSGLMMPIMTFVGNLGYVFICAIGGIMALDNPLFIASIVAFIAYSKQLNAPIGQLANIFGTLQSTAAAAERVFEFLEEKEEPREDEKTAVIDGVKGHVAFENVKFGYLHDKEIIHNFNAEALAGQKIAIVGPTGAGKTTIVNLLMRFYELNEGRILIDGVPIADMKRSYVRSLFGMVLQDAWLFQGTIKENLRFGRLSATDGEIEEACKIANVHNMVHALPGGYDTVLSEDSNLSQGQKQLLTIARAMIQNAPMLILDEATSSVDTRTEIYIQNAMDKLSESRTSFIIAHRLSTIMNADLILVINDGDIIEVGTHETLMSEKAFYYELYQSQFAGE